MSFVILYITGLLNLVIQSNTIPPTIFIYLIVLGVSFFTHELTHKFTAIKFGARAYFRISREGLMFTLISVIVGFPILSVGAVFWWGEAATSTRVRGRVSAAGPISNLILIGVFYTLSGISIIITPSVPELAFLIYQIGFIGVSLNVFLGLFNLLPIGVLDGAKVLDWDGRIWGSLIGSFIMIGFFGGGFGLFF